ncbi:MAG UNVERIFIED_CONTAM: DUF2200 domain-containing protein [Planctomycetaceae bacterium]
MTHRVYKMAFSSVYPHYVAKAEKKGHTRAQVDEVICWLTGYSPEQFAEQLRGEVDFERFFAEAPLLNPERVLVKGVICGVRIEEISEPLMQEIRRLDKLIDDLANKKRGWRPKV